MQCWERCHQGVGCLVVGTDFLFATPCLASPTLKSVASKPRPTSLGKTSSKNRLTGNGKPPVGTEVLEVKPKKNKMVITPPKQVCRCAWDYVVYFILIFPHYCTSFPLDECLLVLTGLRWSFCSISLSMLALSWFTWSSSQSSVVARWNVSKTNLNS